ncbi:MAG: hypothetical protein QXI89_00395 [Candidatus Anstonellales archaeon]
MVAKIKKAQFSVEFLTVLVLFLVIFIPLTLLLLSQDRIKQEQIMNEQENLALFKIKTGIEEAFSSCPSNKIVQVFFPREVNFTIFNDQNKNLYIKLSGTNSYIRKLNVQAEIVGGTIERKSGFININVTCSINNGNVNITIGG